MPNRIRLKRLSKAQFEGLLKAHNQVEAVIASLQRTQWAGATSCIALLAEINQFVCDLYNSVEASLKLQLGLPPIDSPGPEQPAIASAGEPGQDGPEGNPSQPKQEDESDGKA